MDVLLIDTSLTNCWRCDTVGVPLVHDPLSRLDNFASVCEDCANERIEIAWRYDATLGEHWNPVRA